LTQLDLVSRKVVYVLFPLKFAPIGCHLGGKEFTFFNAIFNVADMVFQQELNLDFFNKKSIPSKLDLGLFTL
jgi:hypothetical protein